MKLADIQSHLEWADLVKMDIEGHEKEVLLATSRKLWETTDALVEVQDQDNADEIFKYFNDIRVNLFPQKINWNRAKKIIVANEYEKKIFTELTDESKIEVVRNGINLDDMKSSVKFKKKYALNCNYFLFLGRFHKVKGIDLLLKAIHLIKNHPLMSNVKLIIMGVDFGFEREMFEMIRQMGLDNVVQVIKNPPREDVIASYNESEFLVLPSRWELSPLTPLEGFAFKKPTISTKAHGIPYTLHDRKDSILVESEDFKELSDKIVELLNDKIKCTQLGIEGYQYVQKECNSKKMTHQILNIYEKIT